MLQMAEKEIILKNKQIEALETYITSLKNDGKIESGEVEQVLNQLAKEKKKIETAFQQADEYEETKTELDTVNDQESKFDQSEVSSDSSEQETNYEPSPLLAPTTGEDPNPDFRNSILSANALTLDDVQQDTDKKIDEEIKQNLRKKEAETTLLEMDHLLLETPSKFEESKASIIAPVEEPLQTVNEDELIDQNGEFIIFAENQQQSETTVSQQVEQVQGEPLEPNFSKLNYVNKINILLKALMIERNKNSELGIKNQIMKREYVTKVKCIAAIQDENEQLIEKVAQGEIVTEQREDEINILKKKHMEDKFRIEQLYDKNKSLEDILQKSEISKGDEVKQMETRIETRVQKIIQQKQEIMKQEKKLIL